MSDIAAAAPAPEASAPVADSVEYSDNPAESLEATIASFRRTGAEPDEAPATLGEPAAEETPVKAEEPAKQEAPAEDKPKAAAWAELHKQKKALFQQEQSLKQKYAPLEARIAEFEAAKDDKVAALKLLGYEDPRAFLEEIAETGGKMTPERKIAMQVQKELAELKAEKARENEQRSRAEQEQAYKASVDNHLKNIDTAIKSSPKLSKSLVALEGGREAVLEVMREHYAKTARDGAEGEVMDPAKAAEIVDTNYKTHIDKLLGNEMFREYVSSKLGASSAKLPQKPTVTAVSQKPVAPSQPARGESDDDINQRFEEAQRFLRQRNAQRSAR